MPLTQQKARIFSYVYFGRNRLLATISRPLIAYGKGSIANLTRLLGPRPGSLNRTGNIIVIVYGLTWRSFNEVKN